MLLVTSVLTFFTLEPLKYFRKGTVSFTNVPDVGCVYVNVLSLATTPFSSCTGQTLLQ